MDTYTTRPIEEVDKLTLKNILYNKRIVVSPHALDHLSEKQRKVFKEEELLYMVKKEVPRKIYLQINGRHATYYRKSDGFRKLILDINDNKITIVTFMDIPEIPKVRLKNE
ncbi:hypothetical protein K8R47_01875 [archaeon]|nr:hypothetical protein [archaeon]